MRNTGRGRGPGKDPRTLHALDCSDLAAVATDDLPLLEMVLDARQEISPNDLARHYGLVGKCD